MLCLHCFAGFSLGAASGGYPLVVVCGLLIAVASLVEHGLWGARVSVLAALGLSGCGFWALEHRLNHCDVQA